MKKLFCASLLFFLALHCAFSDKKMSFSIEPQTGVAFCDNGEYVYSPSGKRMYSYLEWKSSPLFFTGIKASITLGGLFLNFGSELFFPLRSGTMYDSDWNYEGVKTTYSIHENYSRLNFNLLAALGYAFTIKRFSVLPSLSVLFSYASFHAQNGYGWYGGEAYSKNGEDNPYDSPFARKAKLLYPIDLCRKSFYVFVGVDFSFSPTQNLSFFAGAHISPYTYIHSYDYHYGKPQSNNDFSMTDKQICNFLRFKETAGVKIGISKSAALHLNAEWIFGRIVKGILYDDDELTTQKSGSDINSVSVSLGIEKRL